MILYCIYKKYISHIKKIIKIHKNRIFLLTLIKKYDRIKKNKDVHIQAFCLFAGVLYFFAGFRI